MPNLFELAILERNLFRQLGGRRYRHEQETRSLLFVVCGISRQFTRSRIWRFLPRECEADVRALVTGAEGFLGANLCAELITRGHEVTATSLNRRNKTSLEALNVECRVEYGDVTDSAFIDPLFHRARRTGYFTWRRFQLSEPRKPTPL